MDTLSKSWKDLGTPPRYWITSFPGAQFSIWIIAFRHYLPTVAHKVKFNSFHPGQQENYIKLTMQITVSILAYSLLVLVEISKVTLYFENTEKFCNHKKSRNVVN